MNKLFLSSFYFWWYAATSVLTAFLPVYLKESFTVSETGSLISYFYVSAMIFPVFGTLIIQKYPIKNFILISFLLLSAICFALYVPPDYLLYVGIFVLLGGLAHLGLPQMFYLSTYICSSGDFGRVRLWGSIGFILASICFGFLFNKSLFLLPAVLGGTYLMSLLSVAKIKIPIIPEHANLKIQITKNEVIFIFSSILSMIGTGILINYFSLFLSEKGYSESEIGYAWAVGVVAEIVMFYYMPYIFKKFEINTIIAISCVASIFRFFLISMIDNKELMYTAQILNGIGYGWLHLGSVERIKHFKNPNFGQALYFSLVIGFGMGIGGLGISYYLKTSSIENIFYIAIAFKVAALLVIFLNFKERFKLIDNKDILHSS